MEKIIRINPADNVAVALHPIEVGECFTLDGVKICATMEIPQGHKMAIATIEQEEPIVKYGFPIGHATTKIAVGEWVHVQNTKTNLSEKSEYHYTPNIQKHAPIDGGTFLGYRRKNGAVGIRNEIWIIPVVGCVNDICEAMVKQNQYLVQEYGLDGIYTFPHPYGCSQMGDDHATTRKVLAGLAQHPNAGSVLVVGLGCENITMEQFKTELGEWDKERIQFMLCQDYEDEIAHGSSVLKKLAQYAGQFKREPQPMKDLVVGVKCGGSDGLSGITANPTVGEFSNELVAMGGSVVLTEVPEMFGAEDMLLERCVDEQVYEKAVSMLESFKEYFVSHGQVVYENPSPGNKQGGITTLEDKSLGCVQKGGNAPIVDVISYAEHVKKHGLTLLNGPGNDLVSSTVLMIAGCHMVLFTTGRGTPFGTAVPTIKISSNTELYEKKKNWIDFNAGTVVEGESIQDAGNRLLEFVRSIASGQVLTKTEENNYRGIAIFKDGVTL